MRSVYRTLFTDEPLRFPVLTSYWRKNDFQWSRSISPIMSKVAYVASHCLEGNAVHTTFWVPVVECWKLTRTVCLTGVASVGTLRRSK